MKTLICSVCKLKKPTCDFLRVDRDPPVCHSCKNGNPPRPNRNRRLASRQPARFWNGKKPIQAMLKSPLFTFGSQISDVIISHHGDFIRMDFKHGDPSGNPQNEFHGCPRIEIALVDRTVSISVSTMGKEYVQGSLRWENPCEDWQLFDSVMAEDFVRRLGLDQAEPDGIDR